MKDLELFCWTVHDLSSPIRLDIFCTGSLEGISRSQLKTGLQSISVNGIATKLSKKVNNGDKIELRFKAQKPETLQLFPYPLKIVYEDSNIIVLNKPSGMVTHPAGGHYTKTLVNALEDYRRNRSPIRDAYAPCDLNFNAENLRRGIVHRLDKDTSGLILTVRNDAAKKFYLAQFKQRRVKKYYLAILRDRLPASEALIKTSIFRSAKNRRKFSASSDLSRGKIAVSRYKVLRRFGDYALVLFRIYTGRTHQIRVHAKFLNSALVGDSLYAKDKKNPLMLHALRLTVPAQDGKRLSFQTKIPKRFRDFYREHKTQ